MRRESIPTLAGKLHSIYMDALLEVKANLNRIPAVSCWRGFSVVPIVLRHVVILHSSFVQIHPSYPTPHPYASGWFECPDQCIAFPNSAAARRTASRVLSSMSAPIPSSQCSVIHPSTTWHHTTTVCSFSYSTPIRKWFCNLRESPSSFRGFQTNV
ncbi:hypothetical protein AE621_10545 [Acidovorax sp. SD340]|nr:hypothetical protein AE621_10545 [Acidovorax sp. SD340]